MSLTCTDSYIISSGLDDKMCVWERKRGHLLYSVDMETSCGSSMAMLNNNFLVTGGEVCTEQEYVMFLLFDLLFFIHSQELQLCRDGQLA